MENISHSHQPKTAVSMKSYNGKAHQSFPTSAKTVYDDVFGCAQRFGGPPNLSPRVEDYAEIFGGFHAPRASSIPVLSLPVLDEAEVFFDVRSAGFDYGEVFGGLRENDFAVSYEDLVIMDHSDDLDDSSNEAWTPSEAQYLSEELDHSTEDQYLSNGDSYETVNGNMEFNISYHQAGQRSNGVSSNGFTQISQLHAVPGYSFMVDKDTVLPEKNKGCSLLQASDDGYLNIDLSLEMNGRGHLRKTLSHPANSIGELSFETDLRYQKRYVRNGSLPNEMFVTISDVSLRTQPSDLPPPSRPPPPLDGKKRDSRRETSSNKSVSSGGFADDNSPPYFDVEVDASSSAAASAAAIKEAMEQAQAKLKSAKELMERKSRMKLGSKDDKKGKEEKVNHFDNSSVSTRDERLQGTCTKEEHGVTEECQKVQSVAQQTGGSTERHKHRNGEMKYVEEKQGRESFSSQGSDRIDGTAEWKEATQFFELVQTNKSGMIFGHAMNGDILAQGINIQEGGKREKKTAIESFQQYTQQEDKVNAVKAGMQLGEYEMKLQLSKDDLLREENSWKPAAVKLPHGQRGVESKVEMVQGALRWEESVEMCGVDWQPVTTEKKKIKADDLQKHENMVEIQLKKNTDEDMLTMKHMEKGPQPREASKRIKDEKIIMYDREDGQKRQKENFQQDEHERKLKLTPEHADYKKRLKEAPEKENEKEKRMKEVLEQREIANKEKEVREREVKEKRLRETHKQEENKRRVEKALVREENERRLREVCQKEDKERRGRVAVELEENEKGKREAYLREVYVRGVNDMHDKLENERRREVVVKQEENLQRQKEACEIKDNYKRFQEASEQEENDKKLKEFKEREEFEKKPTEDSRNEAMWSRIKESSSGEDVSITEFEEYYDTSRDDVLADRDVEEQEVRGDEKSVGQLEEACKQEKANMSHSDAHFKGHEEINKIGKDHSTFNQEGKLDDQEDTGDVPSAGNHIRNGERLKDCDVSSEGTSKIITQPKSNNKEAVSWFIDRKIEVSCLAQESSEQEKVAFPMQEASKSPCANESPKKVGQAGQINGQQNMNIENVFPMDSNVESQGKKLAESVETGKLKEAKFTLNVADNKISFKPTTAANDLTEPGQKAETTKPTTSEVQSNAQRIAQPVQFHQIAERKAKIETLPTDEKEVERIKKEREMEKERLRMIEEQKEREREREREKDRMAVDRVTLEVRERAYAETRERAERVAVERAMNEARERLEKACAEAREKSLDYRSTIEARLRAERAAVERATLEARGRAFGKVMVERSVSDKFSASSWNSGVRPSSSSSDLQDLQSQGTGSSCGSRYPYTSVYIGSNSRERSEVVEHESAQRCKARLERHRRTAERVAKALAEKNMRDLLAQREQTERHRVAETLDADVKRWSTGKEGNLRALLSTLQYILGPDCGWQPIPLTEVITSAAVKKAYRKATLCVHPDKLQQRGASIQQKYICEKVFDLLKVSRWHSLCPVHV
ncbi:hypothetical protein K2173_006082 [Erythroxylum novogranatense]|uniref:Auxilin-like protein 1 n=1 Tax=Erythroxylum novogranatense TaxID=1862640 RepID=A0AAV8TC85_9ROSI|nr:hypothetical protein K2173_006082 [Erythroxylum novogranatense]